MKGTILILCLSMELVSLLPLRRSHPLHRFRNGQPGQNNLVKDKSKVFLDKYGYMQAGRNNLDKVSYTESVTRFQHLWGLPETGLVDSVTMEWMQKPRCGYPDDDLLKHRQKR